MPEEEILSHAGSRHALRDIVEYLIEHPSAKDTDEGIIKWWHIGNKSEARAVDIQRALAFLLQHGLIVERTLPQSGKVYSVNLGQSDQLKRLLTKLMD